MKAAAPRANKPPGHFPAALRQHFNRMSLPIPLVGLAGLVVLLATVPAVYIFLRAAGAEADAWQRLLQTRILGLLGNTLLLVLAVTAGATALGVSIAWLTERTDLPGQRVFRWLFALPLAIPAYIGAIIHLALLRPRGGLIPRFLEGWLGFAMPTPSPTGFWGAAFILTLFSYPYVYLLSNAAFRSLHASLGETARTLGYRPWQVLFRVTLPAIRPGITAGALLVALDVLAEYGTVAMLRFETFSSTIFVQLAGRYDRSAAVVLSSVLITLAVVFLWAELRLQGRARYTQLENNWRPAPPILLKRWRIPALMLSGAVVIASLAIPLGMLMSWSIRALSDPATFQAVWQTGSQNFSNYILNSVWTALLAAGAAVILSLPVAILAVRHAGRLSQALSRFSQIGYAVPGVVTALSVVLLVNRLVPVLYATPLVIVLAYVLRYMPQAVRAAESALKQLSPSFEEASRISGKKPLFTFVRVTLPLILPGLLAGGALVFMSAIKELPATLLLRPAGFDTLAVRVWIWANDGFFLQAAPAALSLVLISILPLSLLLRKEQSSK
jgi:iron(III) transport system permease protein